MTGGPDRRRFLQWGTTGVAVGLGGCQALFSGGSSVPEASFTFAYDPAGGRERGAVSITHDGGGGVRADRVLVRSSAGHDALWSELGSTDVAASERVTNGDTARLDATVFNWSADVGFDERISVVYEYEETTSPTPASTPSPTATPTPTGTPTLRPTAGALPGDDFEADDGLASYTITNGERPADLGTRPSEAPDGGSYHAYLTEATSGYGTWTAVFSDGARWDRSYRFSVLMRCPDWPAGTPYNSAWVAWRGRTGAGSTDKVILRTFDTAGGGGDRPFGFAGGGVVESRVETDIAWEQGVWYRIRGEVSENPGDETAAAVAKIWRDGEVEPEGSQAEARITNGVSRLLPVELKADGRNGARVTLNVAHAVWEPLTDA